MIVSEVQKQPKPNIAVVPQTTPRSAAMTPDSLQETARLRQRAYELYEVGVRKPGHEEKNQLRAEQEILKKKL